MPWATANILWQPLLRHAGIDGKLREVQKRRTFPTRMTQALQVLAHKRVVGPALKSRTPVRRLPWPLRLVQRFPILRRIPARVLGLGFRPEHVRTPDVNQPARGM